MTRLERIHKAQALGRQAYEQYGDGLPGGEITRALRELADDARSRARTYDGGLKAVAALSRSYGAGRKQAKGSGQ